MFDTKAIYALKQSLSGLALRERVIAGNIANVDTPGYKALSVTFEDSLATALDGASSAVPGGGSLSAIAPRVVESPVASLRVDGNTVDIDNQMAELAETSLKYEAAAKLLSRRYATILAVITEGRK